MPRLWSKWDGFTSDIMSAADLDLCCSDERAERRLQQNHKLLQMIRRGRSAEKAFTELALRMRRSTRSARSLGIMSVILLTCCLDLDLDPHEASRMTPTTMLLLGRSSAEVVANHVQGRAACSSWPEALDNASRHLFNHFHSTCIISLVYTVLYLDPSGPAFTSTHLVQ